MKQRGRTEDLFGPPRGGSHHRIITSTPHNTLNTGPTIQYQLSSGVLKPSENINETLSYSPTTMAGGNMVKSGSTNNSGQLHVNQVVRHKTTPGGGASNVSGNSAGQVITNMTTTNVIATGQAAVPPGGQNQFQRLKVEDALSYLDQVKYRFGNQPQVYNDFLDIMKEFKSQSIDTPGVIQRVSNLFKGHPELIVGFNTFLPPGYKIEVQANDQGYAFQVSVSVPSTSSAGGAIAPQPSPTHKLQILQGTGPIVHTMPSAVNLMTHGGHSGTTPMTPTTVTTVTSQPTTVTNLTVPQSPQNFSRERTVSSSSGANLPIGTSSTPNPSGVLTDVNIQRIVTSAMIQPTPPVAAADASPQNNQNQPVEFNHAITYVNKIKNRFQNQPEKYKRFLEILHTYQKEQKVYKEGANNSGSKQLTEAEVYSQVAKLFDNQEDLLREFGQFLPDASSHQASLHIISKTHEVQQQQAQKKMSTPGGNIMNQHPNMKSYTISGLGKGMSRLSGDYHSSGDGGANNEKDRMHMGNMKGYPMPGGSNNNNNNNNTLKRSPSYHHMGNNYRERDGVPALKRFKPICRDVTLAEASKYGTLNDYAFFDKVRKALKSPDVYDNFLRCLVLFNQELISKSELQTLVAPFLSKFPDLLKWFQDFLGPANVPESIPLSVAHRQERAQQSGEAAAMEYSQTDLSMCKRLGASYCALPKSQENKVKCTGRTALCREVLNDTWVSFPTWAEDSTFVTSRKTQYEESIYRCEDERFELDVVIETNSSTIRVLEGVQKKMSRMLPEELARFRLDDCLGGTSPTIHQRALRRIYGDKAADIVLGLKKNPAVAVPVVLRRLKAKEEEWREAQKSFNKTWRDLNEKYYLKSLDHQGINFKQNDIKALRSKSLFNEIEALFEERNEQNEESSTPIIGPHMILPYKDKTILDDAANLLIHHVKRQTGIQKQEKARIKHILRQFVPDLFFSPRQPLSDDEREDAEDKDTDGDTEKSQDKSKKDAAASSSSATAASTTTPANCVNIGDSTPIKIEDSDNSGNKVCNSGDSSTNAGANGNNNSSNSKPEVPSTGSEAVEVKVEVKSENDVSSNERDSVSPPIPAHAVSKHLEEAYTLFFTNQNWYLFLRLHSILCERLLKIYERAQIIAAEEAIFNRTRNECTATALKLKPRSDIKIEDYYPVFLDMLKNVLDGNMDASNYEDTLREMYGIHAYIAFTLDRVVSNAVRQLQYCVTERSALECVELFQLEQRKGGAGGLCRTANRRVSAELAYQRKAEAALQEENIFKIHIYKIDCRVTIELLDTETEDASNNVTNSQNWSNYVERLANPATAMNSNNPNIEIKQEKPDDDISSVQLPRKPLFLGRNLRKCNAANQPEKIEDLTTESASSVSQTIEKTESVTISTTSTTSVTTAAKTECNKITSNGQHVDALWGKKPERMGLPLNADRYYVDDQEQVKLTVNSYKTLHVFSKDHIFYNRKSLVRAKKSHSTVTKKMHANFKTFMSRWLDRNVTEAQRQLCNEWLMGRQADLVKNVTVIKQDNDLSRTPYTVYNRYKVERLEN